jgi:hypothetical protein
MYHITTPPVNRDIQIQAAKLLAEEKAKKVKKCWEKVKNFEPEKEKKSPNFDDYLAYSFAGEMAIHCQKKNDNKEKARPALPTWVKTEVQFQNCFLKSSSKSDFLPASEICTGFKCKIFSRELGGGGGGGRGPHKPYKSQNSNLIIYL